MKENATDETKDVDLLNPVTTTTTNSIQLITTTTTNREPKRYKVKSKTELITLEQEPEEKDSPKQDHHHHHHHHDSTKPSSDNDVILTPSVGMSIQERLAALKKNGEEDWKKRNTDNTPNSNDTEKRINIVKQQKEQLQNQLHMAVPKPLFGTGSTSSQFKQQGPFSLQLQNDQFNIDKEFETNSNKLQNHSYSNESLDNLTETYSQNQQQRSKQVPIGKRIIFNPSDVINRTKPAKPVTRMNSAGSDTDSMFVRNQAMVNNNKKSNSQRHTTSHVETNRVELFSTDSEMDSFFKENETIVNKNKYNNDLLSSNSPKTDEMTINEDLEDDQEFDRIVSEAQRLTQGTRAKPSRKTKSKGNHLKNMQNRIEIQNDYGQQQQQSTISTTPPPTSSTLSYLTQQQQYQQKQQNLIANELATNKKFDKSSVYDY